MYHGGVDATSTIRLSTVPDPVDEDDIANLLCFVAAVLTFFIASLLFICALSTSITWERTASRPETGLLISSVYDSWLLACVWAQ